MAARRPKLSKRFKRLTDAEIEAAATITFADIAHAGAAWERDAPPAFRQLLNATEDTPAPRRRPGSADSGR